MQAGLRKRPTELDFGRSRGGTKMRCRYSHHGLGGLERYAVTPVAFRDISPLRTARKKTTKAIAAQNVVEEKASATQESIPKAYCFGHDGGEYGQHTGHRCPLAERPGNESNLHWAATSGTSGDGGNPRDAPEPLDRVARGMELQHRSPAKPKLTFFIDGTYPFCHPPLARCFYQNPLALSSQRSALVRP